MSTSTISIQDLPLAAFLIDHHSQISAVNLVAENLTGYKANDIVDQPIDILIPPELRNAHKEYVSHFVRGSGAISGQRQVQLYSKQNETIDGQLQVNEIESGYLALFCPIVTTEVKPSVNEEKNAQKVLNAIEEPYWQWDLTNELIYYSAQLMKLLGYPAQSFTGPLSFFEKHIHPHYQDEVRQQIQNHLGGETNTINISFNVIAEGGDTKWVNLVAKILEYDEQQPKIVFGTVKDISKSKLLINELELQSGYLKLAEKLTNTGHWRLCIREQTLSWSPRVFRIHGLSPKTYQPELESAINFYVEKDRHKVERMLEGSIAQGKGFYFKSAIINKLGKKVNVECLGDVEKDENGKVISLFGEFRDISKQEETLEKLKLLALVNHTIKVPIFFIDEQDNVVYQDLSPQAENKSSILFNYINFSITEYLQYKKEAKENGQVKKINISFDKYITVFDFSVTYEEGEGIYIWIVEDVTDKFRKEQQQIISNRMALLGNTFGNVSHDINNVLGVALGATEMLELKFAQGKDISDYIERVKNAIDKGKSVTERLLAFTKKPTIKVVEFDPLEEIVENQHLFEQLLLTTIDFSYNFNDIKCLIKFPQGEFINIILNLVLNAQDAIRESGLIGKIEISAHINDKSQLEIHVNDSGIGIEQENLSKIFDPDYSSKSVNKGNGIGLANVYSTVYKHNGAIHVDGHGPLGGAQMTLIFSAKLVAGEKPVEVEKNAVSLAMDEVPILILDDEHSIAEFVSVYLEDQGAFTNPINTKKELLQVLECEQEYDIFITDMILPDISGREAVELVKERFPNIKIYSMSGYIGEDQSQWDYPVLRKPFNSDDLAEFLANN